jgi:hypothetical protein
LRSEISWCGNPAILETSILPIGKKRSEHDNPTTWARIAVVAIWSHVARSYGLRALHASDIREFVKRHSLRILWSLRALNAVLRNKIVLSAAHELPRRITARRGSKAVHDYGLGGDAHTCHNRIMPSRSSKDHDFMTVGRRVVEQIIGEKLSGEPLDDPNEGKNPHAVALGRLGGPKGGRARAEALSPVRRKAIAKKAAKARWGRATH